MVPASLTRVMTTVLKTPVTLMLTMLPPFQPSPPLG
jgi:hypothetical protein